MEARLKKVVSKNPFHGTVRQHATRMAATAMLNEMHFGECDMTTRCLDRNMALLLKDDALLDSSYDVLAKKEFKQRLEARPKKKRGE